MLIHPKKHPFQFQIVIKEYSKVLRIFNKNEWHEFFVSSDHFIQVFNGFIFCLYFVCIFDENVTSFVRYLIMRQKRLTTQA